MTRQIMHLPTLPANDTILLLPRTHGTRPNPSYTSIYNSGYKTSTTHLHQLKSQAMLILEG